MKYQLLWTGPALEDLRSIRDDIAAQGRPRVGREVPEFPGVGYRELVVTPCRIVYELSEERVVILRIWHGRRDLGRLERPED